MSHPLEGIMPTRSHGTWSIATEIASERGFYLAGGTGLALYLHHRQSTDLDFFLHSDFDPQEILDSLKAHKLPIAVLNLSAGMLNVLCNSVVMQFLSVAGQKQLGSTSRIDTADVASVPDILAMKLIATTGRAKLRDYFDLMVIDKQTGYPIEQGLAFFLERYHPQVPEQSAIVVIQSLGYLDDVIEDETVPVSRQVVADYWHNRSVEVAQHFDRNGGSDVRIDSNQGHESHPRLHKGKGYSL